MDEVAEFCRRVLGDGPAALEAAAHARANASDERVARLAHASRACRERAESLPAAPVSPNGADAAATLVAAVSRELAVANAKLPERHREALALRELIRLDYGAIASVMGLESAAVAPLLARARLRLRAELRGALPDGETACEDRDHALRLLAQRQDGEPSPEGAEEWVLDHLGGCDACDRAHAAMLEASVCYRAWPPATVSDPLPVSQ